MAGLVWGVSFVSSSSVRVRLVEARQARSVSLGEASEGLSRSVLFW
jgi:hypothetical protein